MDNSFDFNFAAIALLIAAVYSLQQSMITPRVAIGTTFGIIGPITSIFVLSQLEGRKIRESDNWRKFAKEKFLTLIFASASAAIVTSFLSFTDLFYLNCTGAFFDTFFLVVNKIALEGEQRGLVAYSLLEEFRGTFFGVWTSYSGLVLTVSALITSSSAPFALFYYISTYVVSILAAEVGYRLGSWVESSRQLTPQEVRALAFHLPHVASYAILSLLIAYGDIQFLMSCIFSTLGCYIGAYLDDGSITGPLMNNLFATTVAFAVSVKCSRSPDLCKPLIVSEFVNSFCGASSAYTSTSSSMHALVVSSLPNKFLDDIYYSTKYPLFTDLRKQQDFGFKWRTFKSYAAKGIGDFMIGICFAIASGTMRLEIPLL